MDEELVPANQRIDNMSFKDLTARDVAAVKLKPDETAKANEPKAVVKEAPAKSKTS